MILLSPQFVAAMDEVDLAGVLGQIGRLLDGRIAAADDHERLVAEARQRPVAHGAGGDAVVLVFLLRWDPEIVRPRAGGDDHGLGFDRFAAERVQAKRTAAEIHRRDIVGDDSGAEIDRLLPHQLHQLRPADAMSGNASS